MTDANGPEFDERRTGSFGKFVVAAVITLIFLAAVAIGLFMWIDRTGRQTGGSFAKPAPAAAPNAP